MTALRLTWDTVPVGYFTAPVRAWFGADWQPQTRWGIDAIERRGAAVRGRASALAGGYMGSIKGLSSASDAAVAQYLQRAAQAGMR